MANNISEEIESTELRLNTTDGTKAQNIKEEQEIMILLDESVGMKKTRMEVFDISLMNYLAINNKNLEGENSDLFVMLHILKLIVLYLHYTKLL